MVMFSCRPYLAECTGTHSNSEVKLLKAQVVLRWGTAWEVWVLTALFAIYEYYLLGPAAERRLTSPRSPPI
jgi:hypothetical protein